jgi:hypothetical protein
MSYWIRNYVPDMQTYENMQSFYDAHQKLLNSCAGDCLDLDQVPPVKALFERVFSLPKDSPLEFKMNPDPRRLGITIKNIHNDNSFAMICLTTFKNSPVSFGCYGDKQVPENDKHYSYSLQKHPFEENYRESMGLTEPELDMELKELPMTAKPVLFEQVLDKLHPATPLSWSSKVVYTCSGLAATALALKIASFMINSCSFLSIFKRKAEKLN